MKAIVTRVKNAAVTIENKINGSIGQGFLVLLGVGPEDNEETASRLAEKISNCRVFSDENGKMNLNISQVNGEFLVVSQFTLYADVKQRRPSFSKAAKPDLAIPMYEHFMKCLTDKGFKVEHGEFGADMQVESVNDGPVTLIFDTDII